MLTIKIPKDGVFMRINKFIRRLLLTVLTAAVIVGTLPAMTVNVSAAVNATGAILIRKKSATTV